MDDNCKGGKKIDSVTKYVQTVSKTNLTVLDLSRKELQYIPRSLQEVGLCNLVYLYLDGNSISVLPDNFFSKLPNIEWLDLRTNKLCAIPSTVRESKNLKTLLLGENHLRVLPAELGLLRSLTGLNLSGNPLEEPPQQLVEKGVHAIRRYFLQKLGFKGADFPHEELESEDHSSECEKQVSENSERSDVGSEGVLIPQNVGRFVHRSDGKQGSNLDEEHCENHELDHASQSVSSKVALCYYGSILGSIPNSYIIRPWKTGVYFRKEVDGSVENLSSSEEIEHANDRNL